MANSRVAEFSQRIPASENPELSESPDAPPGRRALRGLTHTGQRRALSPPERFQAATRAHRQRQAPVSLGYRAPSPEDRRELVLAGNEALSRITQSLSAARVIMDQAGHTRLGAAMGEYGRRAGLAGARLPQLGNIATVVCALIETADAIDRGNLRRATDVMASATLNALLGRCPWTAVPAAVLTLVVGSDWPAKLVHHLSGTDDLRPIDGARFLSAR